MLISKNYKRKEDFLGEFDKKFSSFCEKAPAQISYLVYAGDKIEITDQNSNEKFIYNFDFTKTAKENIFDIKQILIEKFYPKLIDKRTYHIDLTREEKDALIEDGMSIEEVALKKKTKEMITEYICTRVIVKKDFLFVLNTRTNVEYVYQFTSLPVTVFLKRVRINWDPEIAFTMLQQYATMIEEVDPNYKKMVKE